MTPTQHLGERYLEHCEKCEDCRPWTTCVVGARILAEYTDAAAKQMAPKPVERGLG